MNMHKRVKSEALVWWLIATGSCTLVAHYVADPAAALLFVVLAFLGALRLRHHYHHYQQVHGLQQPRDSAPDQGVTP